MSQYPPYPQGPDNPPPHDPYAMAYQSAPVPDKPGSITFLAVLAIVFGGLFSLCTGIGIVVGLMQLAGVSLMSGPSGQIKLSPALQIVSVFITVIELALYVALLMIGIGALSLKPWTRRAATSWWSAAMTVWAVVRVILQITWIGPISLEMAKKMQQPTPGLNPAQLQTIMSASMIGGAIFTFLLQILLPILFLALWRRPNVIGAFEMSNPPGQQGAPNPYGT